MFKGKKVVLFAVPGAFTPTCSAAHLPGFRDHAAEIKAKGVDSIACVAVNDVFVMNAWGKDQNVAGKVDMLADAAASSPKQSASPSISTSAALACVPSAIPCWLMMAS